MPARKRANWRQPVVYEGGGEMQYGRRTTRAARSTTLENAQGGGGGRNSRNSSGGSAVRREKDGTIRNISLSRKRPKAWIEVHRPPAAGIRFSVPVWIREEDLTPIEREKYLPEKNNDAGESDSGGGDTDEQAETPDPPSSSNPQQQSAADTTTTPFQGDLKKQPPPQHFSTDTIEPSEMDNFDFPDAGIKDESMDVVDDDGDGDQFARDVEIFFGDEENEEQDTTAQNANEVEEYDDSNHPVNLQHDTTSSPVVNADEPSAKRQRVQDPETDG